MLERYKQRFSRKVESAQYQAIQLISVKRSYLERRDKNRFRELVDIPAEITLSEEQVIAATSHAKETLVVAGAGSGKTFVLVGRAKYLVGSARTTEDKILMLAYNKDAAEELSRRTKASGIAVTASTFHAFGGRVINGPDVSTAVAFGSDGAVKKFLETQLRDGLDREAKIGLAKYFSQELVPYRDFEEFESLNEYAAYVRATIPRTLMDEQVKSHGEWLIANFLFSNSIDYTYETLYEEGKSAKDRHKPDFSIWQQGKAPIWIEYFGTDRSNSVAPGISKQGYLDGIKWKKEVHARNSTTLIELYYYDLKEGTLLTKLEAALKKNGIKLKPKSADEILEQANKIGYDSRFLKVCEQFLGHVRANRLSAPELVQLANVQERDKAFIRVFNQFLSAYENELSRLKLPDYAELIHGAADAISNSENEFTFTHVLVDEFQDISSDRNRLIESMKLANPKLEVTCVGDDWQSIYRFSGSDVSIMREASKPKMIRKRVDLTATYRLPQVIADISRIFVLKNPLQLEKNVYSKSDLNVPGKVVTHWDMEQKENQQNLLRVIERIGDDSKDPSKSIRILARYVNNLPGDFPLNTKKHLESATKFVEQNWDGPVDVSSIHAAKGLEADYVVVMDMVQDFRGFPSTIEDDPVMRLVMPEKDLHQHGEERRLFYVALTRARRETHLISPISAPSLFTLEMLKDGLGVHVGLDNSSNRECPSCKCGRILVSNNGGGSYCSNIPLCDFISPLCLKCQKPMTYTGGKERYRCEKHPAELHKQCFECAWGVLVPRKYLSKRTGMEEVFFSCHTWPKTRCKGKAN
jgi:DNA helicase-4